MISGLPSNTPIKETVGKEWISHKSGSGEIYDDVCELVDILMLRLVSGPLIVCGRWFAFLQVSSWLLSAIVLCFIGSSHLCLVC